MKNTRKPVQYVTFSSDSTQRLDNYLFTFLKGMAKSHVYRIIRKGEVRVNKKRAKPEYKLQDGDVIRIPPIQDIPESAPKRVPDNLVDKINKWVLYEDKALLIINKPAGLAVHGGSGINFGLIEAVRAARPREKLVELAHRLDRDTSGCIMLVKKASVLKEVHQLLREGKVVKKYVSLLMGQLKATKPFLVEAPLQKFELQSGERLVKVNPEGKPSTTQFIPKQKFETATLVDVQLMTGRTHQIRVHAQSIGHPLAGDDKYGDNSFNHAMRKQGLTRLFLHAAELQFYLPSADMNVQISAPLPDELQQVVDRLAH